MSPATPLPAPEGFSIIRREGDDGAFIVEHRVGITTKLTIANAAELLENEEYTREAIRHAVRALARRVIEQCEAVLA